MNAGCSFGEFIRRIRAGDERAARELVERYEPVIRREVRLRLRGSRLWNHLEWTDIRQSVMGSFFSGAASGKFDLDQPDQLVVLLVVMSRHKLSRRVRRISAARRDYRRVEACDPTDLDGRPAETPSPSRVVAARELLEEYRDRLSDEERLLADLRAEGCEWAEITAQLGGSSRARCKQLARAVKRVASEVSDRPARNKKW
jgi:RNA polymerase sigma-70 factor (ECF subfamily)